MKEIPIMFCFDNNYVIPASICFNSIMLNSNKNLNYHFFVLHSDITEDRQKKLKKDMQKYENCVVEFIDMQNKFSELFKQVSNQSHFSKEVLYKILCPSIFPKLNKLIITDVDVVFENDIALIYHELDDDNENYIAGIQTIIRNKKRVYDDKIYSKWSENDLTKLKDGVGGGFLLYNLDLMRKHNIENMFLDCLNQNAQKLVQMEQDVINVVCYQHIKKLKLNYMVCSYEYTNFRNNSNDTINYTKEQIENALKHPIQIHYASHIKPWNYVDCEKSDLWFKYLGYSEFIIEYLKNLKSSIKTIDNWMVKYRRTKIYNFLLSIYHLIKK